MKRFALVFFAVVLAPGPPVVAQDSKGIDPRAMRARWEAACRTVPAARSLIEIYGDDACFAVFALSVPTAHQFCEWHNRGELFRLPEPRMLLQVISRADRREAMAKLQTLPGDPQTTLQLAQAERDVNDIADYLKQNQRAPSVLERLRQEIEHDTKAAQSEPERLARTRATKEQGPIEVPKKDKGMER